MFYHDQMCCTLLQVADTAWQLSITLVVAINLFSDWLRDELNPKLARQT